MWKQSLKGNCHLVGFFYPLFSSVGSYTTLTSVASSGALSNVTNICQMCGVCLCEYLLGVLPRLGSWLSFVIWKSIKEDFCQIRDFYTLLCTNRSRHSPAEPKTSKLRDWQTEVPRDTPCLGFLDMVGLLETGGEQHPVLLHELKWNCFNWPCCEGLGTFYAGTEKNCLKSFITEVVQNWQSCHCTMWVTAHIPSWPALQWSSDCWVRQINNCFNKTE